jgi:hypothetical protein
MSDVKYDYSKVINSTQLSEEIRKSTIVTALSYISTESENVQIFFKEALSTTDKDTLDILVGNHIPQSDYTSPINKENTPIFEPSLRRGREGTETFTIVSHDFSDRTTWYQNSIQVTGQTLSLVSGNQFQAPQGKRNWINILSPKLTLDYNKVLEKDGSLSSIALRKVKIYANANLVNPSEYTIDFTNGSVTFSATQSGVITADFWHNDGVNSSNLADFIIKPLTGYALRIQHVEIQVSKNIAFNDTLVFETWAGANLENYGTFNDSLFDLGYGRSRAYYRSVKDLINWCNNSYPVIPACGDLQNDVMCFPFIFLLAPELNYKQKSLIRLCTQNGVGVNAEIATATFYMEKSQV